MLREWVRQNLNMTSLKDESSAPRRCHSLFENERRQDIVLDMSRIRGDMAKYGWHIQTVDW